MNDTEYCINVSTKGPPPQIAVVNFAVYNIALPVVCSFGLLGNIFNLLTLRSPILQSVSYMYLRALGVADLCCMVMVLLYIFFESNVLPSTYGIAVYRAHFQLPIINVLIASGVLIIVALTVERYVSVVWPLYFSRWNTADRALVMITTAYIFSLVLYIPMTMEKQVVSLHRANSCVWDVKANPKIIKWGPYIAYKFTREVILRCLPIMCLSYFNIHIILKLRVIRRRRHEMTNRQQNSKKSNRSAVSANSALAKKPMNRDEDRLLVLLATIVILFFICNIPAAINLVIINEKLKRQLVYFTFRACANLLEIANHAVNFYIFCCCSKDYRAEFLKTFPFMNRFLKAARRLGRRFCMWEVVERSDTLRHRTLNEHTTRPMKETKDGLKLYGLSASQYEAEPSSYWMETQHCTDYPTITENDALLCENTVVCADIPRTPAETRKSDQSYVTRAIPEIRLLGSADDLCKETIAESHEDSSDECCTEQNTVSSSAVVQNESWAALEELFV